LDENLSGRIAQAARTRGLDVLSAQELGNIGISDEDQVAIAAAQTCCLVTRDIGDFPELTRSFAEAYRPHAGVAVVPRTLRDDDIGGIVRALSGVERNYTNGLPSFTVVFLSATEH